MPGPYPLPTLSAIIDASGIYAPSYVDVLASLQASYQSIFGTDAYLAEDSQDGQWIAILARAIFDHAQSQIATFNAFSPAKAVGEGLSSVIKINGMLRLVPSQSTVPVDIGGTIGTPILNGIVGDGLDRRWFLPPSVTIPVQGVITVTATAEQPGQLLAEIGSVNQILTPVPGWQTVTNRTSAAPGQPVENDYTLRRRQTVSTALPAQAILSSIYAQVVAVTGVARAAIYENDSASIDDNTLPPHSIAVVAEGGDVANIATAIAHSKPPGSYTYGSVSSTVIDSAGVENLVRYFPLTLVIITVEVYLAPLDGWLSAYGAMIQAQVAQFLSTLPIGFDSYTSKLFAASELAEPEGLTYDVTAIYQRREDLWFTFDDDLLGFDDGFWFYDASAQDLSIDFNEAAFAMPANISVIFGVPTGTTPAMAPA